jgi:protein involved in polysaccharide export with SLBB domain
MKVFGAAIMLSVALAASAATAQQPTTADYVLERGDEITIRVFNRPELEDTVQIRPDGKISLVLVDDIAVAGLTSGELDARLTEAYSKYFRDVQLAVIVRKFVNQKVFVGGEVGAPGFLPIAGRFTALTAVLQAGGFKGTARTDSVMLVRNQGGKPQVVRVDLKGVVERGLPDVDLQPFDVVYVPMSKIAKANKFVDQYIRQMIPISLSAGFSYILGDSVVVR